MSSACFRVKSLPYFNFYFLMQDRVAIGILLTSKVCYSNSNLFINPTRQCQEHSNKPFSSKMFCVLQWAFIPADKFLGSNLYPSHQNWRHLPLQSVSWTCLTFYLFMLGITQSSHQYHFEIIFGVTLLPADYNPGNTQSLSKYSTATLQSSIGLIAAYLHDDYLKS